MLNDRDFINKLKSNIEDLEIMFIRRSLWKRNEYYVSTKGK